MNDTLRELLRSAFGFASFRPHQEDVCRAVLEGRDALLVMPTGAGKSLCYQLPGLAKGGTTLVISPLIALMEDQVLKMQAKGFRAERIHAGRERADSRRVCFDYLDGKLDYLYVAPERLGVPRFPEMLAKRKPALIAVDEAHCISHWGHDFRPDYRKLRERLAPLRPTPIMAVTATATKLVQDDIVKQLGLEKAARFIHGFRRTNLAIEVVELTPSLRDEKALELLSDPQKRPAIVYSPTRKSSEQLAAVLKPHFPCEAYHAGLPPAQRDRIQSSFIDGNLEVIVATVAFGMGIDKANVRTVIHTALPGSLEAYYQEIGRAGRDGELSRAILMHSYADRRTHEFFHERDYPETSVLKQIFEAAKPHPQTRDDVFEKVELDSETFERALEKLWTHGGVEVDFEENIQRGVKSWEKTYVAQREHKLAQLEEVASYVKSKSCRMGYLVQHFGDEEGEPCEMCDYCAADECVARVFREPTAEEREGLSRMFAKLNDRDGMSVGKLHQASFDSDVFDRKAFEDLLDGLARSGFIRLAFDTFEADGRVIRYQKVYLTEKAEEHEGFPASGLAITQAAAGKPKKKRNKKPSKAAVQTNSALDGPALEIFKRLRDWRLSEAKKHAVPAFCILSDRVMRAIAVAKPDSESELLEIHGFGPKLFEKHGGEILATLRTFDA